ncbi:DsbE family thiol:disulfide interchange protein [Allosphingosinicella sp.]|uniref:DsbE family thiol:disulfide interchange protein n=1 Tax=Allosphingosinicella sp. TaxID=2823234 RepID=UPI002F17A250
MRRRLILWVPLGLFALFVVVVTQGLVSPRDTTIRSRLVGKALPDFELAAALPSHPPLSAGDLRRGQPRLLNVFASWCAPCVIEAPQLMELKRRGIPIDAIAVRDRPEDVAAFLAAHGDPFERIGSDPATQVQIALGSSGVPETFVIDGSGVIRHQHIGVITPQNIGAIVAAWEEAR